MRVTLELPSFQSVAKSAQTLSSQVTEMAKKNPQLFKEILPLCAMVGLLSLVMFARSRNFTNRVKNHSDSRSLNQSLREFYTLEKQYNRLRTTVNLTTIASIIAVLFTCLELVADPISTAAILIGRAIFVARLDRIKEDLSTSLKTINNSTPSARIVGGNSSCLGLIKDPIISVDVPPKPHSFLDFELDLF